MPLEATMILLDNSEYMRNGDYQPTRFGALADAVTTVVQTKIDANPENTVGVMTMANKGFVPRLIFFFVITFRPPPKQPRGSRHAHQRVGSGPRRAAQDVYQPRSDCVYPHRDRDRAARTQTSTEQEPTSAHRRLCRFPAPPRNNERPGRLRLQLGLRASSLARDRTRSRPPRA
jgi:von Willebrand factor type A domain